MEHSNSAKLKPISKPHQDERNAKKLISTLCLALSLVQPLAPAVAKPEGAKFRPYKRMITTWVPPYAVEKSKAQLASSFGTTGPGAAITHLALQFWVPTLHGEAKLVNMPQVTDQAIADLRNWSHKQGIRAILCVYNGANKWDWPLAKAAFADNKAAFINSLISQMEKYKLDGIDIDLEGPGEFPQDKKPFIDFMTELSKQLRARKKALTVDTFQADKWNTPNQTWWPALFPLVDAITSMGYDDSGFNAPDWRAYSSQKKIAGKYAAKLQLGVPSDKGKWRGNTALEQLEWIRRDGTMGTGIWDSQLPSPVWRSEQLWKTLAGISQKE